MGKEANIKPPYEILAFITINKDRVLAGNALSLYTDTKEVQKMLTVDIAKALKADIVELKTGDYMVIRV
ncbi:hypothetical protein BHF71_09525 [Vulcanibacillus modesticaldus]|uniref:Uncharacterized protein n=1 Tax=Vulcanibacillus modesticaldus TaxID=337097 RepID=A0A1D2YU87_9BACI|nr:hypothetical protein [Vulcanibacillus modesticaldus]OEF99221.1 hypothetical protein BHF71_09525 [Vulcanibacillus modesticaldus]